ncbi:MAG: SusC/RagA family TonB-linked outer membrane protein, partial [Pedobacter sp.]|uniref:SusC/RagA family TonB-linked outer membrane protein n=1 Tax=Pedobacter sp. TaxID=1411316 RepID=UPI003563BBD4
NISGGNAKSTYYGSFGYFDQEGIVASKNSVYKRFTARFSADHNIAKSIKLGTTISYARNNSIGVSTNSEYGSPLSRAINIDPITPLVETDPLKYNAAPYNNNPVVRNAQGFPYGISQYAQSEVLNPIAALAVAQGNGWSDKVVANGFVEVEVIKGFKLRSSAGADLAFWGSEGFTPINYLNSINQSTITSYNKNSNRGLAYIIDYTANYSKKIGDHNFSVLGGYSFQKNKGETQGGTKEGIPVDNIKDASLQFPVTRANDVFYGGEYLNTLTSIFARITYDYKEKYLLTAITRRDGSSKFGPNNKYGYFPSASVGWVASKEDFFPQNNIVNQLKFRGSYGILGNNQINDNLYIATVSGGRNYTFGGNNLINGVSPNALSNPDLKWEETSILDFGVDLSFFNSKLTLTADYFHKKTYGMLQSIVVPSYVGNNGPIGNVADNSNKGFDFELGYKGKVGQFTYSVNANGSFIKNTTDFLGDDKTFINGQGITPQNLTVTRTQVGSSFQAFYGYVSDGLFQNATEIANYKNAGGTQIQPNAKPGDIKFIDLNNDGVINDNDRQILGNSLPDFTYGLTFNIAYKGFDLYVLGQGVTGNLIFNGLRRFDLPTSNYTTAILDRWTGEGTTNNTPRLTLQDDNQNYSRVSSFFLEDGSYFRLKTLQIGYTLPNKLSGKAGLNKVRIYLMANNLVTLTKYTGYDPEIGGGSFGVDRGYYPQARTFYAGINFGF